MSMKRIVCLVLLALVLPGCGIKPWVQPYERQNLADPIMSFSRNPAADAYGQHVNEVREAARGATGSGGGGCGCN